MGAWKAIIMNVDGANYASELKRQGNQIIENTVKIHESSQCD